MVIALLESWPRSLSILFFVYLTPALAFPAAHSSYVSLGLNTVSISIKLHE